MKIPQIFRLVLVALFFTGSLGACKKEADPGPQTRITFWSKRQEITTVKVDCYVDGQLIGTLTKVNAQEPAYGEPGLPTAQVTPGVHTVEFRTGSTQIVEGDVDVPSGQCRTAELT